MEKFVIFQKKYIINLNHIHDFINSRIKIYKNDFFVNNSF